MLLLKRLSTSQALLREVFFCLLASALISCEAREDTPDWPESPATTELPKKERKVDPLSESNEETVLMVYNLRNYLSLPRSVSEHEVMLAKPQHEIDALIKNISRAAPDILGICEIGTLDDLKDLRFRLKEAGSDYQYSHLTTGSDTRRRLAILSKLPLKAHHTATLTYNFDGSRHKMLRGILDVTISLPAGDVRFLGVHFKSKRPSKYWDQSLIRRHEAELTRRHITSLLETSPEPLLLYGDLNDSKQSPAVRAIVGNQDRTTKMSALDLRAADGSRWTHYWAHEDIYSRFDYVFVSPSLKKHIVKGSILELEKDDPASDHRPLVITIR